MCATERRRSSTLDSSAGLRLRLHSQHTMYQISSADKARPNPGRQTGSPHLTSLGCRTRTQHTASVALLTSRLLSPELRTPKTRRQLAIAPVQRCSNAQRDRSGRNVHFTYPLLHAIQHPQISTQLDTTAISSVSGPLSVSAGSSHTPTPQAADVCGLALLPFGVAGPR